MVDPRQKRSVGMLLGKFLPPHRGHVYLIDFAKNFVDHIYVVCCSLSREPIAGDLRFAWLQEIFAAYSHVTVVHLTDENPQYPHEDPDFWQIWRRSLQNILPEPIDFVFASEEYGAPLAQILQARFVPVDIGRQAVPVSGTAIRRDPWATWDFLPAPVRRHFVGRISIFGPESAGKSTLAAQLAERYQTKYVAEYARTWLDMTKAEPTHDDMIMITRGQASAENALVEVSNRLLFCDTDPLLTLVWFEFLFQDLSPDLYNATYQSIARYAVKRRYDVTLLLAPDLVWEQDHLRYQPNLGVRQRFYERCKEVLEHYGRHYVEISGQGESRFYQAAATVNDLLAHCPHQSDYDPVTTPEQFSHLHPHTKS